MAAGTVEWLNPQNGFGFIQLDDGGAGVFFVHISAVERAIRALAAKHRIALNQTGESVHITTGRKLAEGFPTNADSVMVLLDCDQAFTGLGDSDLEIFWGAYLGTEKEVLVAGKLADVMGDIGAIRERARRKHGWIMDSYLLRKSEK